MNANPGIVTAPVIPAHIAKYSGEATYSGGWFTHDHAHSHPPDKPGAQHRDGVSHRHEHQWEPDSRHHHDPTGEEAHGTPNP